MGHLQYRVLGYISAGKGLGAAMGWRWFRDKSSTARRDALALGIFLIGALVVSNQLDLFGWIHEFDEAHPAWNVDDFTVALTIGSFGFGWYGWRRQRG